MRRFFVTVASLALLAWVGGSAFVVVLDPPAGSLSAAGAAGEAGTAGGGLFGTRWEHVPGEEAPRAYVRSIGVRFAGTDDDAPDGYEVTVRRGRLDRASARFPLSVLYAVPRPDALASVEVHVTADAQADLEDPAWRAVGPARIETRHGWSVATLDPVDVPASSTAVRITETRVGAPLFRISTSLPEAPTVAGRLYDRVAWWAPFRWLPRVRGPRSADR